MAASPQNGRPDARSPRHVVIVGAGLAGLRAAASLRELGFRGEITVLGAEGLAPYDRPPLTKQLLTRTEPVWLSEDLGADIHALADRVELASPARAVSPHSGPDGAVRVERVDGEHEIADVVVLACGSHAWTPPDWTGAAVLHTAADAAALRARLTPGSHLVCVGAGWIGAEISGVAAAAGCRVTALEAGPAPLARQVSAAVGALTTGWYAEHGVELHVDARVSSVHADRVHLADGHRIDADVVLAAVGARPTTGWLDSALSLSPRGALAVDRFGRASGQGFPPGSVYGVGDCADRTTERDGRVEGGHWSSALHDPTLVALDILGGPVPDADPPPHTFSTQFGHEMALIGQPDGQHELLLRGDPSNGAWTALYLETDPDGDGADTALLAAGLAVDAPRDVGALRRLLGGTARVRVDRTAAADPSVPLRDAVR